MRLGTPCLIASLLLGGCASMGKNECINADWYAVGLEDGAQGRPIERLGEHRRACAEYGVAPATDRYLAGRAEGLKSFCTYERGYSHGRAGNPYSGACPEGSTANFLAGYTRGRELHDLERRLQSVQEQIRRSKAALTDGMRDPRDRAREAERLENLSREADQLEGAIGQASGRR
jgi:hypothetical protein